MLVLFMIRNIKSGQLYSNSKYNIKIEYIYFTDAFRTSFVLRYKCIVAQLNYTTDIRLYRGRNWTTRFRFPASVGIFPFATASRPTLAPTQPPIQWILGALSPRVKPPGREADHSPTSSAKVKNAWSCTSTPRTSSWLGT
jgi:hypothetical protein